jgi:hypothetical protein
MTFERIPCHGSTQFFAASTRTAGHFRVRSFRFVLDFEAYIAGSANWKLSIAGSQFSQSRTNSTLKISWHSFDY